MDQYCIFILQMKTKFHSQYCQIKTISLEITPALISNDYKYLIFLCL